MDQIEVFYTYLKVKIKRFYFIFVNFDPVVEI
jgi:hypothetical protein